LRWRARGCAEFADDRSQVQPVDVPEVVVESLAVFVEELREA
jgi:hypothetical protein